MEKFLKGALLCMSSLALGACEKEIISDDFTTDSSVSIRTRSVNAEETISYPVAVYVFNQEGKCVENKMLSNDETPLTFSLPNGTYTFYAIGGVDQERYNLPAKESLTEKSEIILKEGKEHADLMTAQQVLELKKNEEHELSLCMERQVIELTSVTLSQIPTDITSVSISLTPCYKSITIDGSLGTLWEHQYLLTNNGDGVWNLPTPTMILLSPESSSIIISMTDDNGTVKQYTYRCDEELKKNHQIRLNGTFQENNNIEITGNIKGTTWSDEKEIIFNFGEENTITGNGDDDNNDCINEETPQKGTIYNGCYVLEVIEHNNYNEVLTTYNEVLLVEDINIDLTKEESEVIQDIQDVLSILSIGNISGWRLPNKDEANMLINEKDSLSLHNIIIDIKEFIYIDNQSLRTFNKNGLLPPSYTKGKKIIPVKTLKFKKQA